MYNPRGMSLIEVMIAMSITSVIFVAIYNIGSISQDAIYEGTLQVDLETKAQSVVDRIGNDLKEASSQTLTFQNLVQNAITPASVTFKRCTGYSGNQTSGSATTTPQFVTYSYDPTTQSLTYSDPNPVGYPNNGQGSNAAVELANNVQSISFAQTTVSGTKPTGNGSVQSSVTSTILMQITITLYRSNYKRLQNAVSQDNVETATASTTVMVENP